VIFDEDITYRTDDIEAAVREEVVVLAEVPPLPEEDQDDLFEFDTDQIPWPRVELRTPIPSSPASPPEEEEAGGHLPSPESLTLDEESQKADDEPTDGHEADEAGRTDDSEFSGAEEEPRARSPSQSETSENHPTPSESAQSGLTPSTSSGPTRGRGSRAFQGIDSSNIQTSRTRRRQIDQNP
jgi:hypothetical protein